MDLKFDSGGLTHQLTSEDYIATSEEHLFEMMGLPYIRVSSAYVCDTFIDRSFLLCQLQIIGTVIDRHNLITSRLDVCFCPAPPSKLAASQQGLLVYTKALLVTTPLQCVRGEQIEANNCLFRKKASCLVLIEFAISAPGRFCHILLSAFLIFCSCSCSITYHR